MDISDAIWYRPYLHQECCIAISSVLHELNQCKRKDCLWTKDRQILNETVSKKKYSWRKDMLYETRCKPTEMQIFLKNLSEGCSVCLRSGNCRKLGIVQRQDLQSTSVCGQRHDEPDGRGLRHPVLLAADGESEQDPWGGCPGKHHSATQFMKVYASKMA